MDSVAIWKHLQHLREIEISNIWIRTKLLGIFIGFLFGGYGVVLLRIVEDDGHHLLQYHLIALVLSVICLLFSIIWILMSKGSKAWYEVYEKRIGVIENELKFNSEWRYNYRGYNVMPRFNNCIMSTKAGAFSPSKILIFIGIAMFWIWLFPVVLHSIFVIIEIIKNGCCVCMKTCCCTALLVLMIGIPILLYFRLKKLVKSKYIRNIN